MKGPMLDRGVKRAGYRLSSLVLEQAVAWLAVGNSILSIERKKNELL